MLFQILHYILWSWLNFTNLYFVSGCEHFFSKLLHMIRRSASRVSPTYLFKYSCDMRMHVGFRSFSRSMILPMPRGFHFLYSLPLNLLTEIDNPFGSSRQVLPLALQKFMWYLNHVDPVNFPKIQQSTILFLPSLTRTLVLSCK